MVCTQIRGIIQHFTYEIFKIAFELNGYQINSNEHRVSGLLRSKNIR